MAAGASFGPLATEALSTRTLLPSAAVPVTPAAIVHNFIQSVTNFKQIVTSSAQKHLFVQCQRQEMLLKKIVSTSGRREMLLLTNCELSSL